MKRADISTRLFGEVCEVPSYSWYNFDEYAQVSSYQKDVLKLKQDVYKVAFDNIFFLSHLDLYMLTDDEIPAVYILYDGAMTLLECVSFNSFIDKFVATDHHSNYDEYQGYSDCINSDNYNALTDLQRKSHSNLLGSKAIDAINCCDSNAIMRAFFFKLMAVSTHMARITGESNVYNDYRVDNNIHVMFAFNKYYDCDINTCRGAAYVYATGEYIDIAKPYKEYENEFHRGDFTSIGITHNTPVHLWKKMSERDYYAAPKHPYTPPQPEPATQTPQIWSRVQHPWGYPQPHMPCPAPQAPTVPTVGFNLPF